MNLTELENQAEKVSTGESAYRASLNPALAVEVGRVAQTLAMNEKAVRRVVDHALGKFVEEHLIGQVGKLVLGEMTKLIEFE